MSDNFPAVFQADRIRAEYQAERIARSGAIQQIRAAYDGGLTEFGAAELLDNPTTPSRRFADETSSGKSHVTSWYPLDGRENA